ncbi:hypothetical protein acdb102_49320 [Acidothermaceae bacterium B102]|nr:hypothetical protein acdb102_49320 [Acidothermaceae bacterium B102]
MTASPAWQTVLATVSADGSVSTATALQAFSLAFGPLPGVSLPPGNAGVLEDGTGPMRWLVGHWADITPTQRAAAIKLLPHPQTQTQVQTSPKALGGPHPMTVTDAAYETSGYKAQRTNFFYTQEAQQAEQEIAAKVGRPLGIPVTAYVNGLSTNYQGATSVYSPSGAYTGTPARCQVAISVQGDQLAGDDLGEMIRHEVWHCFEATIVGLHNYYNPSYPQWIIEGQAEWVGTTLVPTAQQDSQFWPPYLTEPGKSLFSRAYSAVGFWAQLAESGTDVWSELIPVLEASGNPAAFEASGATGDDFLSDWAAGYFRDASRGAAWDIVGPGATSAKPDPTTLTAPAGRTADASAQPYTAAVYTVNPVDADLEHFIFSGHARVSDTSGHDYPINKDALMCVKPAGCTCPAGAQPPPSVPLTGGPFDLAVTGDPSGDSGTVSGESLKDYCQTCPTSGTAIPAGTYSGPISGSFLESLHVSGQGQDGSGQASFTGSLTIRSDGTNVFGTIAVKGPGSAVIGQVITTNFFGGMKGNVYGSASDPMSKGSLDGESDGTPTHSTYNAGLHVTNASCASVSGDLVAMLQEITKPVAQYLTLSGKGTWTIPRKN